MSSYQEAFYNLMKYYFVQSHFKHDNKVFYVIMQMTKMKVEKNKNLD